MNKLFRPYFALLLMGALLVTTSCKDDDDPAPTDEGEVVTTVMLALTPEGKGQDASATISTLSGTPSQNAPLVLRPNTVYNAVITLRDESKNPAVDITQEVNQENDEHELFYTFTPDANSTATVTVEKTDFDRNNRTVGLAAKLSTGSNVGAGRLRVVLKHQPGGLKTGDATKGETDVDVAFETIVQQ
ncbi:hypothetical protein [Pontibacter roseus]|uniref:hypothetical protein n=1 Tax=Pontibacter roseus TaxID=336989 RepID=UPI0003640BE8|nr:hypothetical protein [Pontibacter roseus]